MLGELRERAAGLGTAGGQPEQERATIDRSLPRALPNRSGWAADIDAAFRELGLEPSHENICAVVAVIEQESGFHVDPLIPGLPAIAWREIDSRAERAGVPHLIVHTALQLKSPTGRSYSDRIDSARTEKDLSDIFEDSSARCPWAALCSRSAIPYALAAPCKSMWHSLKAMRRSNPTPTQ